MKNDRRTFLKLAGMAGLMAKGRKLFGETGLYQDYFSRYSGEISAQAVTSIIGSYGPWAAGLLDNQLPLYSFRRDNWKSLAKWAKPAKRRYLERLSMPAFGGLPQVNVTRKYTYDGLYIEEMNWALPNGGAAKPYCLNPLMHPAGCREYWHFMIIRGTSILEPRKLSGLLTKSIL